MRPIRFARAHPVAVVTNMALGMIVGPAILGYVRRFTGVSVRLPSVGG
jgi:hypothetical protein